MVNFFFFILGMIVGWNFFPQPAIVKSTVDFVVSFLSAKTKEFFSFLKSKIIEIYNNRTK